MSGNDHRITGTIGRTRLGCTGPDRGAMGTTEGIAALCRTFGGAVVRLRDFTKGGARAWRGRIRLIVDRGQHQQCGQNPDCTRSRFHWTFIRLAYNTASFSPRNPARYSIRMGNVTERSIEEADESDSDVRKNGILANNPLVVPKRRVIRNDLTEL